jgi:hypothetical protein
MRTFGSISVVPQLKKRWNRSENESIPDHPFKEVVRVATLAPQANIAYLIYLLLFSHLCNPVSLLSISFVFHIPAYYSKQNTYYFNRRNVL